VPLFSAGRCLGHLGGDRAGRPFEVDAAARRMLTTVAVVAATLLEKALVEDELRRLDAAKSQFVALAAHELRAPAAIVAGAAETLDARGARLSDEQRRPLLELVHDGARRLTALVDQLVDLSRLDAAAITLRAERLRLRSRVEQLVDAVARERRGDVEVAIPPELEAVADATAFDRILANLLANALRHGGAPIVVSAAGGEDVVVVVEDRGGGVAAELVPRLFDRFTRGDERAPHGGAGLGLAIARAYARAQGGDLVYEPASPHGARFRLTVPTSRSAAPRA
jgi:two-component system sensor histidine kinase MtrB